MPLQPALRRPHTARRVRAQRVNCVAVGQCFDIEVTRDLDGWVVRIPEVSGFARVARRAAVELAARKCIANRTGIPIGYVAVYVKSEIG
jgi:hypothetical protein